MKAFIPVCVGILLLFSTAAVAQTTTETGSETPEKKDWLIMVYMVADNNLENYAIDDINEMERGVKKAIDDEGNRRIEELKANGTKVTPEMEAEVRKQAAEDVTSKATIAVQIDRSSGYDTSNGDWTGTKRYIITPDATKITDNMTAKEKAEARRTIDSMEVQDLGEVNMGDPNNFTDFVNWATKAYPANNTMVVLWNHGMGWKYEGSEISGDTKSVGYDEDIGDGSGNMDALTPEELGAAFDSLPNQTIIGYDACLMQMAELGYEYKDHAQIIVASEETEPGTGWSYEPIAAAAFGGASSEDLAKTVVNSYKGPTLSAVRTDKIGEVANGLDDLMGALSTAKVDKEVLKKYNEALRFEDAEYGDVYSFASNIADLSKSELNKYAKSKGMKPDDPRLKDDPEAKKWIDINSKANNLMGSVNGAVIAKHNEGRYKNAGGISVWMPMTEKDVPNTYYENMTPEERFGYYSGLAMSEDTKWDESVTHLVKQSDALKTTGDVVGYDSWW